MPHVTKDWLEAMSSPVLTAGEDQAPGAHWVRKPGVISLGTPCLSLFHRNK